MKFRIKWNKERKDVEVDPSAGVGGLKQAVNKAFGTLACRQMLRQNAATSDVLQVFPLRGRNSFPRAGREF